MISAEDRATLTQYLERLEHLAAHSVIVENKLSYKISVGPEGVSGTFIDHEAVESFATRIRHFYMHDSVVGYRNILRLLGRYCTGPGARLMLKNYRVRWNHSLKKGRYGWSTTNRETGVTVDWTPDLVLQCLFNGDVFHVDNEALVTAYRDAKSNPMQWAFFRGRIQDAFTVLAERASDLGCLVRWLVEMGSPPDAFYVYGYLDRKWLRVDAATAGRSLVEAPPELAVWFEQATVTTAPPPRGDVPEGPAPA
jgi:hypothetical protein